MPEPGAASAGPYAAGAPADGGADASPDSWVGQPDHPEQFPPRWHIWGPTWGEDEGHPPTPPGGWPSDAWPPDMPDGRWVLAPADEPGGVRQWVPLVAAPKRQPRRDWFPLAAPTPDMWEGQPDEPEQFPRR